MAVLGDTNVYLALSVQRSAQHQAAKDWFDSIGEGDAVVCRVVQLGLMRHLTNVTIMQEDVLNLSEAMTVWQSLLKDRRIRFVTEEPPKLEFHLAANIQNRDPGRNIWTDAYLAAFAQASDSELATFDRGFRSFQNLKLRLL